MWASGASGPVIWRNIPAKKPRSRCQPLMRPGLGYDSRAMQSPETKPTTTSPPESRGGRRFSGFMRALKSVDPALVVLLIVVGVLLARGITQGEPFFNVDETYHTMNGVFIRDAIADGAAAHPLQYAKEYYAKYPAVKMPWWPPFFPFAEAIFFLILGVSVWVSRLAILSFALLSAYFWYRIAERFGPRSRALVSAAIFCFLPAVMIFESVVMLEVPQLATCLGAIYFWLRWLETERARDLWVVAGVVAAAMLTSPASVFLALFLGVDFMFERRWRLLRNWQLWGALTTSLIIVLSWYLFSFHSMPKILGRGTGQTVRRHARAISRILFYPRALPHQLGLVLLVLAAIGVGWCLLRAARRYRFLMLWVFSAYLSLTLIAEKETRHILIWLPPLVYFALIGVDALLPKQPWRWAAYSALGLYFLIQASMFRSPRLTGAEPAARFVFSQPESDIVYYRGNLDTDFIFWARQLDPQKRRMVVREKDPDIGEAEAQDQFFNVFRTWGVRYAVVDSMEFGPKSDDHPRQSTEPWLREALHSGQFELVTKLPVELSLGNSSADAKNVYEFGGTKEIEVYRYRGEIHRTTEPVSIFIRSAGVTFSADLSRLAGKPWPD